MRRLLPLLLLAVSCSREDAPRSPPPETMGLRPLSAHGDKAAPPEETRVGESTEEGAVSGTIEVASRYQARVMPGATLFVVARNAASHQILAVLKESDVHFPFPFRISGANAMTEGTSFTGPLDITARISKTGEALPSSGDLEGTVRALSASAKGVRITIDTVRQ